MSVGLANGWAAMSLNEDVAETFLPDGLFGGQVSITMSKCTNGRLKPFRYSLLVYTEFMKKSLIQ
jgi:hypothetical protein